MFIPIFIAILMGLISPNTKHTSCNGGTVYVSMGEPGSGDDPGDGEGGDDDGINGPGGTGTSGGTGQNPPPPPPPPPHP